MEPFGTALRHLMADRRMEQLELATIAKVSQSAISYYLRGERNPRPRTIEWIARALGLEPEYFIEYRRWRLHRALDEWIETDEAAVEYLLSRLQIAQGPRG